MKLAAKVHRSKDNRLILIAHDLDNPGKLPGMSVALKELGFEDGDMIEFRRMRQAKPDPKPEPKPKRGQKFGKPVGQAIQDANTAAHEERIAKQEVEA